MVNILLLDSGNKEEDVVLTHEQNQILSLTNKFVQAARIFNNQRKELKLMTKTLKQKLKKATITDYYPYTLAYLYQQSNTDNDFLKILPVFLKDNISIAIDCIVPLKIGSINLEYKQYLEKIIPTKLFNDIYHICINSLYGDEDTCITLTLANDCPYDHIKNDDVKALIEYTYSNYIDYIYNISDLTYIQNMNILLTFYPFLPNLKIKEILQQLASHRYNTYIYINHMQLIFNTLKEYRKDFNLSNDPSYNKIQAKLLLLIIK